MRLVAWNILHGGGQRVPQILDQLKLWRPDVLGLSEFRGTPPSRTIAAALKDMGLVHQHTTVDPDSPKRDALLLASRVPFAIEEAPHIPDASRWLHATLETDTPWSVILMWVPNRDKSGIKYDFHAAAVESLRPFADRPALALGDTNTGVPGVDEAAPFFNEREGQWFDNLAGAGWHDLWRERNPDGREYTWHTHNGGAGFRIDQAFATASASRLIDDMRHDWGGPPTGKLRGPSDHAAVVVDVALSIE